MHKDATYKEKMEILEPWIASLVEAAKKDLKQEHLPKDKNFTKQYFAGKPYSRLTTEEMGNGYSQAIAEGREDLGEFICTRWLLKNSEIYQFFYEKLHTIDPNFDQIETLEKGIAEPLIEEALKQFGPVKTYLFSIINSVVFAEEYFHLLREKAKAARQGEEEAKKTAQEERQLEDLIKLHRLEMERLVDKYEKKLKGLRNKYFQDVDGFKKQIVVLQRRLAS